MARAGGTYDRERSRAKPKSKADLGPGHNAPSGDASDPRAQNAAAMDASDPRGAGPDNVDQHGFNQDQGLDRGGLRDAESKGFYNNGSSASPEDLNDAEDEADEGYAKGFDDPKGSRGQRARAYVKRNRSKMGLGGGILGGGILGIFMALFMVIPLKIEHIVRNLEDRFTHPVSSAVEETNNLMLKRYMLKFVLPDYAGCGTTIDRHCHVRRITGRSNPVRKMYQGWANTRLETKLAEKYKIELKYHSASHKWYLITPDNVKGQDIGAHGEGWGKATSRREVKRAMVDAMKLETKWQKVMYRFKIGRLLAQKYGIKRCIFFCGTRKKLLAPYHDKKLAAKLVIIERVIQPRDELVAISLKCILTPDCHPDQTDSTQCDPGVDCEARGSPMGDTEREQRTKLLTLAEEYGITDAAKLAKLSEVYTRMSDRGFSKFFTDEIFKLVFSKEISQKISDSLPVVGWINLAAEMVGGADHAGEKLKKLSYLTNGAAAVGLYMSYRTFADEIHTSNVDPVEVGSMVDSLGTGTNNPGDPAAGGTATAEAAPLYDDLVGGGARARSSNAVGSLLSAFLPAKAYAAAANPASSDYKCGNGKFPGLGKVCPEELLGAGNGVANAIHDFLHLPGLGAITTIANAWNASIGQVFDLANDVIGGVVGFVLAPLEKAVNTLCSKTTILGHDFYPIEATPFVVFGLPMCKVKGLIEDAAPDIIKGFTNALIPNPFSTNMGGGRVFTEMAAGASVAGKDSCEQIGCKTVPRSTVVAIIKEQEAEARDSFEHQPFLARMFSTESSYSLVSRMAMATPIDLKSSAQSNFAGLLSSPLTAFSTGIGSMLSGRAFAATAPNPDPDPFQIGTTAWTKQDIQDKIGNAPDEAYDNLNCDDTSDTGPVAMWQKAAASGPTDPLTGMPQHTTAEPCLLLDEAAVVSGATSDSSLLSEDDAAEINPVGTPATPAATGDNTLPTGSAKDLASQLLPYISSGKIVCGSGAGGSGPANCYDIQETAKGNSIKNSACYVDALKPELLGMLLKLVQMGHSFGLSALCTDHPSNPTSTHHYGKAADFSIIDGTSMSGTDQWSAAKITAGKKLDQDVTTFMPKSTTFGQVDCHPNFSFLNGFDTFTDDPCHHQHINV